MGSLLAAMLMFGILAGGDIVSSIDSSLTVAFEGGYGSAEVGGPFVGFESHHSRPAPSRVSFFAPVANSMDLSDDYWRRDETHVLLLALQVDDGPRRLLHLESWPYQLSPAAVVFSNRLPDASCTISYKFCQNLPAMTAAFTVHNGEGEPHNYRLVALWETSLRTCHSYHLKDHARTSFDAKTQTIFTQYDDPQTADAVVLIGNAGEKPVAWSTDGRAAWLQDLRRAPCPSSSCSLTDSSLAASDKSTTHRPVAAFLFEKELAPGEEMNVVQFVASCSPEKADSVALKMLHGHAEEVAAYDESIHAAASGAPVIRTNVAELDHSTRWAKAMLAANRHYLDGELVPMPCPAQYNFFFAHDALMTDLAAANFDAGRVRADLLYLAHKVNDEQRIPHAYYWKDDGYKTEFAGNDNWNHFWFIMAAASYLRHSADLETLRELLPLLEKSLDFTLSHLGEDGLLWAGYPDWWDIGKAHGPRAYMTALAIRALQDFIFIGANLNLPVLRLQRYAEQATALTQNLSQILWSEQLSYLINYNHGDIRDDHIYAGSLLAVMFDALPDDRQQKLVATARARLYDPQLGLRTVDPADFHLLEADFHFVNHEQGRSQGEYINGGVWPHCTAWYALALQQTGETDQALEVVRNNMTLTGIMNSPRGQPAMYEYRYSDPASSSYGRIDKPNFLWAGGWYLFTLYRLLGAAENPWNLHLLTDLPSQTPEPEIQWLVNGRISTIAYSGRGKFAARIEYDGKPYASLVIPINHTSTAIKITRGAVSNAYLEDLNASLLAVRWNDDSKSLRLQSRAFPGHQAVMKILSVRPPQRILVDQKSLAPSAWAVEKKDEDCFRTAISYSHFSTDCEVIVEF